MPRSNFPSGFYFFTAVLFTFAVAPDAAAQVEPVEMQQRPHNVVLMIADGAGPAAATLARDFAIDVLGRAGLALDGMLVGTIRTRSADSRVTDSAAGATAYATGVKTTNGAVGVDPQQRPVGTVLEAAEMRGMATGLVALSYLADATPAAFAAHVADRDSMNMSAAHIAAQPIDVIFGGGKTHFIPVEEGGSREDHRNLLQEWRDRGYQIVLSKPAFEGRLRAPVAGLFADGDMSLEIDRDEKVEPGLAEMALKAIHLLEDDPDGFFLMVEGSNVDVAGHDNDAAAYLREMLAYDEAVAAVLDFARRDGRTLVVSVADHETGGLTVGRGGGSAWNPERLAPIKASQRVMARELAAGGDPVETLRTFAGIDDLREAEVEEIRKAVASGSGVRSVLTQIIGRRALVGWTTGGHTAVDVNLYAYGPGWERFIGNHDNTFVGRTLADLLDLDLRAATEAARAALNRP